MLGMKVKDIAAMEGITPAQAGKSIHAALRRPVSYTHLDVYKRQQEKTGMIILKPPDGKPMI